MKKLIILSILFFSTSLFGYLRDSEYAAFYVVNDTKNVIRVAVTDGADTREIYRIPPKKPNEKNWALVTVESDFPGGDYIKNLAITADTGKRNVLNAALYNGFLITNPDPNPDQRHYLALDIQSLNVVEPGTAQVTGLSTITFIKK